MGVVIPSPLPQLNRVFDYLVPAHLQHREVIGSRVRVRFHGRLLTGFAVPAATGRDAATAEILDVKGPPVAPASLLHLTHDVARRQVGLWHDVLRSAVPPRHARVESSLLDDGRLPQPAPVVLGSADDPTARYPADPPTDQWPSWAALLRHIQSGGASMTPRAALTVPWGWRWESLLVAAVQACAAGGRRALVVLPDARMVHTASAALRAIFPPGAITRLTADQGPEARYRAYLRALSGQVTVVVGTRGAVFTQLPDLGLIWLAGDGDPALTDPQAPYWHAREVAGLRSASEEVPLVIAGRSRTPETQRLVSIGWAKDLDPPRTMWRAAAPRVRAPEEWDLGRDPAALTARLPSLALAAARSALATGPLLVSVPRRGYVPVVACASCRHLADCPVCGAALALTGAQRQPTCPRCGWQEVWTCPECGGQRVRAVRFGAGRTAEELARAFPHVPVLRSDSDTGVRPEVPNAPAIVVATPGAEPSVEGRYQAALLLDGDVQLAAPRLRAGEEVLYRWCRAVSMVRSDGAVVVVADPSNPVVQALVRADPTGWAARELAEREAAGLPPAVRFIALEGPGAEVAEVAAEVRIGCPSLPDPWGPVALPVGERLLLRTSYRHTADVVAVLAAIQRERGTRRAPVVTIRVDPGAID